VTQTPLITQTEPTRSTLLKQPPVPSEDLAMVCRDRRGMLRQVTRPLTYGEIVIDRPRVLYRVDTAEHQTTCTLELPAQEDALGFRAQVQATWQVTDPCDAVQTKLIEAEPLVRPHLEQTLRTISRTFSVEQRQDAERAMLDHYVRLCPQRLPQGVSLIRCSLTLDLDESTAKHLTGRVQHRRSQETRFQQHDSRTQDTTLTLKEDRLIQELTRQQAEFDLERKRAEEEHRLEVEKMRMGFYVDALNAGQMNLIALRLASNRSDVNEVISLFMNQRQLDYEGARGMLNALLESNLVNRKDVADIMARATAVVADHLTNAPFTLPQKAAVTPALPQTSTVDAPTDAKTVTVERMSDDDDTDDPEYDHD
jgi:hypothetical protein